MKKALIFAASAFAVVMAKADVMNWQINDESLSSDYHAARLYYTDSSTPGEDTEHELATSALSNGLGYERQINLDGVSSSGTYFYIEVGNYNDTTFQAAQRAGAYSYSDLVSAGLISTGGMNQPPSGFSFGDASNPNLTVVPQYSAVPEPGTAGLILLGLAVAGLKRRRV